MDNRIKERYHFLLGILGEMESVACHYFRSALAVENKDGSGGFDPVTLADREIEALFRKHLALSFPDDAILGEEFTNTNSTSPFQWIIDPIDGTRAFLVGSPSFTILICLKFNDENQFGLISQPFTGERFMSFGGEALWIHQNSTRVLKTSTQNSLSSAIMASTFPEVGTTDERAAFDRVNRQVKLTRYGMDGYAYGLLAAGHVDLIIEAGLKPFDYAAPWAVIEAAGGVLCSWTGAKEITNGQVLAAANWDLANAAIALLQAN